MGVCAVYVYAWCLVGVCVLITFICASASVQRSVGSMRSVWSVWSHHVRLCVVVGAVGEVDEVGVVGVVAGRCTVLRHQSIGIQWSAAVER